MSKVFKGIKKIHKKVFKAAKKHLKKGHERIKKYGKYVAMAVAIYFTAGAAMAAFAPTAGVAAAMPGVTSFAGAIGVNTAAATAAGTAAAGAGAATAAGAAATGAGLVGGGGIAGAATSLAGAASTAAAATGAGATAAGVAAGAGAVAAGASAAGTASASTGIWAGLTSFQKAQVAMSALSFGTQAVAGALKPSEAEMMREAMTARWSNYTEGLDPSAFQPTQTAPQENLWANKNEQQSESMESESTTLNKPDAAPVGSSVPVDQSRIGGMREGNAMTAMQSQPSMFDDMSGDSMMASDRIDSRTEIVEPTGFSITDDNEPMAPGSEEEQSPMSLAEADDATKARQDRAFAKYDPFRNIGGTA